MRAGRKLDRIVAEKVMGWRWYPWTGNTEQEVLVPHRRLASSPDFWGRDLDYLVPRYSTDIAAAWQVVDHMRSRRYRYEIKDYGPGRPHCVSFFNSDEHGALIHGNTPSHAICLAALAAMGVVV